MPIPEMFRVVVLLSVLNDQSCWEKTGRRPVRAYGKRLNLSVLKQKLRTFIISQWACVTRSFSACLLHLLTVRDKNSNKSCGIKTRHTSAIVSKMETWVPSAWLTWHSLIEHSVQFEIEHHPMEAVGTEATETIGSTRCPKCTVEMVKKRAHRGGTFCGHLPFPLCWDTKMGALDIPLLQELSWNELHGRPPRVSGSSPETSSASSRSLLRLMSRSTVQ